MSQSEAANVLGVSRQYINILVTKGHIKKYEGGKVDFDELTNFKTQTKDPARDAQREYLQKQRDKRVSKEASKPLEIPKLVKEKVTKEKAAKNKTAPEKSTKEKKDTGASAKDTLEPHKNSKLGELEPLGDSPSFAEAKTYREAFMAKIAELTYKEKTGELMSVQHAKEVLEEYMIPFNHFLNDIPIQLKNQYPEIPTEAINWITEKINNQKRSYESHPWIKK